MNIINLFCIGIMAIILVGCGETKIITVTAECKAVELQIEVETLKCVQDETDFGKCKAKAIADYPKTSPGPFDSSKFFVEKKCKHIEFLCKKQAELALLNKFHELCPKSVTSPNATKEE